jgi:hypothetical protein
MRKLLLSLIVLALTLSIIASVAPAVAQSRTIVIAVDLAHGESDKYLGYIQRNITSVTVDGVTYTINWINITKGMKITLDLLRNVDILLIGQPTTSFAPEEMEAIKTWLQSGNKVLYIAGDSDYGGGPNTIDAVNKLLEYIGSKLRLEQASVYTPYPDVRTYVYKGVEYPTNAKAYYRVLAFVEPDPMPEFYTYMIDEGITKPILMHGPTCVIWVDEYGNYKDPVNETFPGLIRLVWFRRAYIGDNNPPPPYVYNILDYGQGGPKDDSSFVAYATEYLFNYNSLITVSGESLYGDYEPAWSSSYYGVALDGPKFVTNLIRWWVKIITVGPLLPKTVTVTVLQTVTQIVTETKTVPTTQTVTVEKTVTQTATSTTTITQLVTATTMQTVVSTTTQMQTLTVTATATTTTTQTITDWTITGVLGVVLLVIGIAIGYIIKRK